MEHRLLFQFCSSCTVFVVVVVVCVCCFCCCVVCLVVVLVCCCVVVVVVCVLLFCCVVFVVLLLLLLVCWAFYYNVRCFRSHNYDDWSGFYIFYCLFVGLFIKMFDVLEAITMMIDQGSISWIESWFVWRKIINTTLITIDKWDPKLNVFINARNIFFFEY